MILFMGLGKALSGFITENMGMLVVWQGNYFIPRLGGFIYSILSELLGCHGLGDSHIHFIAFFH